MPDTNGGTGYQLTRELADVKARVEMMIREEDDRDDTVREIFTRLGALERKMAQVLVIATVLAVILPVAVEGIVHHVRSTVTPRSITR